MIIPVHKNTISEVFKNKTSQTLAMIFRGDEGEFDSISLVEEDSIWHLYLDTMYRGGYDLYPDDGITLEQAYINTLILEELYTRPSVNVSAYNSQIEMINAVKAVMEPTTEAEVVTAVTMLLGGAL